MIKGSLSLPPNCWLRRATAKDLWSIRKLVLGAKLDPTQLRWQQFWLIESDGIIVACGQLRNFAEAQELGSLVVVSPWRRRGLGTYLTKHLIAQAKQPLYLECLGRALEKFYTRFGFVPVTWQELPKSIQLKFILSHLARKWLKVPVTIMHYQG